MPRVLAIDYGKKRTGVAVTDPLKIIATALATIETKELIAYLKKYIQTESVERFVLGEAKNTDGTPAQSQPLINLFEKELIKHFPTIPITKIDERYTSKMAFQTMIDVGIGKMKRREKGTIDRIAAVIILQSYLEQNSNFGV
jgi:putative Holliday junction resolvase